VAGSPHPPADLAEIVRIYGIRHWIEQSYKQVKDEQCRGLRHLRCGNGERLGNMALRHDGRTGEVSYLPGRPWNWRRG
jgi:hypothetical protein